MPFSKPSAVKPAPNVIPLPVHLLPIKKQEVFQEKLSGMIEEVARRMDTDARLFDFLTELRESLSLRR